MAQRVKKMKSVISGENSNFVKYCRDVKVRNSNRRSVPSCRAAMALPNDARLKGRMAKRGRKGIKCRRRQKARRHCRKHCLSSSLARVLKIGKRRRALEACSTAISFRLEGAPQLGDLTSRAVRLSGKTSPKIMYRLSINNCKYLWLE